jgi:hypothetical protein
MNTRWLFVALASALLTGLTGCVERRFVIDSVPSGAQVLRNNQPIGFTPADDSFIYHGKYQFTLIKDGYETLHVVQHVRTPWWQIPPLDFITENVIPFKFREVRRYTYVMKPLKATRTGEVLQRATGLREQGRLLPGTPRQAPVPPGTPAGTPATAPGAPPGTPPGTPAAAVVPAVPAPLPR